ncbi:MAG TPA: hypothetical protein PKN33_21540 [Phycisphaerae bacterium]|nr:hypothetical protein [Phycisphaerae bacterium]
MPRDEQLIARRAFIDAHCGRRWRSAIRMIVGVFLMLIVIGSITGWLFCESKAWIHSETHIGISSGWFVYERDPTDEIYTCFKDDTFLEFEEWLADHWLMWNDFGGGHQIILHLPTIALFAGLFLGAVIASSMVYAKRRTTLTHALTNLENNCVS